MARKSKVQTIVDVAVLTNAGYYVDGDVAFAPEDKELHNPMDFQDAIAHYQEHNTEKIPAVKRTSENRASQDLVALTRSVAQAYSNNFTARYQWGEEEVNMKRVVASVVQAWCVSKYAQENCQVPSEKQVKNALNTLKRAGEIVTTQKGSFRASAQASTDWTKFI